MLEDVKRFADEYLRDVQDAEGMDDAEFMAWWFGVEDEE